MAQNPLDVELYHRYLLTDAWRRRRDERLRRDEYTCTNCGDTEGLQVHHLNYSNIFDEHQDDLVSLCIECHEAAHSKRRPKFELDDLGVQVKLKRGTCADSLHIIVQVGGHSGAHRFFPVSITRKRAMRKLGIVEASK